MRIALTNSRDHLILHPSEYFSANQTLLSLVVFTYVNIKYLRSVLSLYIHLAVVLYRQLLRNKLGCTLKIDSLCIFTDNCYESWCNCFTKLSEAFFIIIIQTMQVGRFLSNLLYGPYFEVFKCPDNERLPFVKHLLVIYSVALKIQTTILFGHIIYLLPLLSSYIGCCMYKQNFYIFYIIFRYLLCHVCYLFHAQIW